MKRIAIEIGICAIFALTAVVVVMCSSARVKQARFDASEAAQDAKDASEALLQSEKEKRELEAVLRDYDASFKKMQNSTTEAVNDYAKRNKKIMSADSDWLAEPVPDSVRDAFTEFICQDDKAAVSTTDAVRKAGDTEP